MVVDRVRSETTHLPGRSLNQARANHFVIDSSSGPSEAVTSIEAFIAGISSCGVNIVHSEATTRGLTGVRAALEIEGRRSKADPSTLASVELRFTIWGATKAQADELVATYTRR